MTVLREQTVFALFIGKAVNPEALASLAHKTGTGYAIRCASLLNNPRFLELSGITGRLQERWEYSGVEFDLHLTLEGETIVNGFLDKYREGAGGHGRPVTHVLTPNQQELRVARRILQFLTV